ncbi:unnamed protein product [Orchesella dallaii]|uniref:RBR-type E3 ubiquitin transferase n=1 Tax=Orchesella dallaii TaxID=48710 RepID=A0ABP1QK01_9HEXA
MAGKREAPGDLDGGDVTLKKQKMYALNNNNEECEDVKSDGSSEDYLSDDDCSGGDNYYDMQSEPESETYATKAPPKIELLNAEDLQKQMRMEILQVQQKLHVSASVALLLLNHFSWDTHKLCEKYYEDNRDEYFKKHGLPCFSEVENGSGDAKLGILSNDLEIECQICLCPFRVDQSFEYPHCGHQFCSDCIAEYLKTRISENGLQSSIECPESKCNVLLKEDFIKNVIKTDGEAIQRYDLLLINDYVTKNNYLKYCPGERCKVIWKRILDGDTWNFQEVACDCGESYCFSCNHVWHFPLNCKLLELWRKKLSDESENSSWIMANTKPCPKCGSNIQKNGGCNHMTCRKCSHQFCWLCLTDWKDHRDFYYCNRNADPVATEAQDAAKNHLQRFIFANDRYLGHGQSYDLEKNLLAGSLTRMDEIKTVCGMGQLVDASFYVDAIKALLICRKLLQYSFAFVFFLERNSQVEIFETNMINLHEAVEDLSHYLEEDKSIKDLGENKLKVLNLTNFCKHRRKVLIEHVNEGYADGKWNWSFRQDLAPGLK